jgi:hypothetical protein
MPSYRRFVSQEGFPQLPPHVWHGVREAAKLAQAFDTSGMRAAAEVVRQARTERAFIADAQKVNRIFAEWSRSPALESLRQMSRTLEASPKAIESLRTLTAFKAAETTLVAEALRLPTQRAMGETIRTLRLTEASPSMRSLLADLPKSVTVTPAFTTALANAETFAHSAEVEEIIENARLPELSEKDVRAVRVALLNVISAAATLLVLYAAAQRTEVALKWFALLVTMLALYYATHPPKE